MKQLTFITAADLAGIFKSYNIPVVEAREGCFDEEGEVQINDCLSVTVSVHDVSFALFEILNQDFEYKVSNRMFHIADLIKAVKQKLE